MEKIGFVHPHKTGGTSIKKFISDNYKDSFLLDGFESNSLDNSYFENSFVVFRDPLDRFFSLYSYWLNGSELNPANTPKYKISDFIWFLKSRDCALITKHTPFNFFKPQSEWIKPEQYHKTIILVYNKLSLSDSFDKLLEYLEIPNKYKILYKINVTLKRFKTERVHYFAKNLNSFIKSYYEKDIDLFYNINNNQDLFKKVIKP